MAAAVRAVRHPHGRHLERSFWPRPRSSRWTGMVFVEDILARAERARRRLRALAGRAARCPRALLARRGATPDSLATVIFSSGSTGVPKGVMLSHYNVLANIEAMAQVFWIGAQRPHRRRAAVLPLVRLHGDHLVPADRGCGAVYHPNPTDAKAIGELVAKYRGTFLLSTPTFCAAYTRKCSARRVRHPALRAGGRGEAARAGGRGVPREVRPGAAGRLRLHRDVAGGGGERARLRGGHAIRRSATSRARWGIRCRAWRRRIVDPADVRADSARIRKACCW